MSPPSSAGTAPPRQGGAFSSPGATILGVEGLALGADERAFLREADPEDNRVQRLFPTAKGREEAQRMLGLIRAHEDRMLAGLTLAERDELRRMLAIIWREDGEG